MKEFYKPINLVFLIIAIVSLLFAYYTWQTKSLTFTIDEPGLVFDKSVTTGIQVYDLDSNKVESNIYLYKFTALNDGDSPVEKGHIRMLPKLEFPNSRILNYEIIKNVDQFAQFEVTKLDTNKLQIEWNNFDPGSELQVSILTASKHRCDPQVSGAIQGFNNIEFFRSKDRNLRVLLIAGMALFNLIVVYMIYVLKKASYKSMTWIKFGLFMVLYDIAVWYLLR